MTKIELAQKKVDEARAAHLALCRAIRPLDRTEVDQLRIDCAWLRRQSAEDWLVMAKREVLETIKFNKKEAV